VRAGARQEDGVLQDSRILLIPKKGGSPRVLATGLRRPSCLALDASHAYIATLGGDGVMRVPL
jgi:hypothetical protein